MSDRLEVVGAWRQDGQRLYAEVGAEIEGLVNQAVLARRSLNC